MKIPFSKVLEDLEFLSDRISTQVRTVAVSLIVLSWGLLIGSTQTSLNMTTPLKRWLMFVGILALVAMVFDFLQYLIGYQCSNALREKMETEELEEASYDCEDWRHRIRRWCFCLKQIIVIVAAILFLVILIPQLLTR